MMIRISTIAVVAVFLFVFFLPFHVLAQTEILNIRHWAAPDHTRVVIDTSDDIPYTFEKTEQKVLINFKDTQYSKELPHEILLKKPGIDRILVTSVPVDGIKVELFIAEHVEAKIFKLKKFEDKPARIVIDLEFPEVEKQESQEREQVKVSRKNKIIVIDPGHGGEDPGAVGRYRTHEKKVVLEISRKLKTALNKKEGYRAFLTRDGDYYVPFKKRLKIAREYGADLFISIHADSFKRRDARGSSVYCLSVRGASSEAAKLLAGRENLADIVGGSPNGESSDESDPIILNMFQTNTINTSKVLGSNLLKHLDRVGHVKFSKVQEAPFRVLKLPEVPSVLVETAYISNPNEERLLRTGRYQSEIAEAIASAISEFLPSPLVAVVVKKEDKKVREEKKGKEETGTSVTEKEVRKKMVDIVEAQESTSSPRISSYKVEKGDTLEKIAKKHGTTISALLKLNRMKLKDPLHAGRKLKISETEKEPVVVSEKDKPKKTTAVDKDVPSPTHPVFVYKVKRGDTLDKIAKKFNTTVSALLKMNHMKLKDPLYIDRKLKVEGTPTKDQDKQRIDSSSAIAVYKVKRGDTLDGIAKKFKTSVDELRKLNRMKRTDTLYIDQKLKLPQNPS
jgi:N-acetylmuramoyl-L-alanine amidase